MIQAFIVYGSYLVLAAITLLAFWTLQIRYGQVSDLDPNNLLVRWFSRRTSAEEINPVAVSLVNASTGGLVPVSAVGTVAILVISGVIARGGIRQQVFSRLENAPLSLYRITPIQAFLEARQDARLR